MAARNVSTLKRAANAALCTAHFTVITRSVLGAPAARRAVLARPRAMPSSSRLLSTVAMHALRSRRRPAIHTAVQWTASKLLGLNGVAALSRVELASLCVRARSRQQLLTGASHAALRTNRKIATHLSARSTVLSLCGVRTAPVQPRVAAAYRPRCAPSTPMSSLAARRARCSRHSAIATPTSARLTALSANGAVGAHVPSAAAAARKSAIAASMSLQRLVARPANVLRTHARALRPLVPLTASPLCGLRGVNARTAAVKARKHARAASPSPLSMEVKIAAN